MTNRWVLGARPKTLTAAVAPVLVGTAAVPDGTPFSLWRFLAVLVVAVAIQVGTNYVNDYADGERGADDQRVGPVRLVASGLASTAEVKRAALAAMALAGLAGLALAVAVGPELLVVGAASILAGYLYTAGPRPYGYLGMGEVFVFVFFGVVATVGSAYVQAEQVTLVAFASSVGVGALATALMVTNNLRDIPTDRMAGKVTLAVRMGDERTRWLYVALVYGALGAALVLAPLRWGALLAVVVVPKAAAAVRRVRSGVTGSGLIAVLEMTGQTQILYAVTLAVGLTLTS